MRVKIIVLLIIFIYLTWPFLVGRWVFEAECKYLAGIHIDKGLDARQEGFFDYRLYQQQEFSGVIDNLFWRDVDALGDGHVAYFEAHTRTSGRFGKYGVGDKSKLYTRYFLADSSSKKCVPYSNEYEMQTRMMELAPGKCLASEVSDVLMSKYEIKTYGYHHTDSRQSTEIINRDTGETSAKFWSFNHFNPLNLVSGRDGVCPKYADLGFSPHSTLPLMLFVDRNGQIKSLEYFEAEYRLNTKRRIKGPDISKAELHRIQVVDGFPPGSNKNYHVVDVVVTIAKPVVLLLESENKVHWRLKTTPGSDVRLVVASSYVATNQARGSRYIKTRLISHIEDPEIRSFLSTTPTSEQSFHQVKEVVVDGKSRDQTLSP